MEEWGQLARATAQSVARNAYGKLVAYLSRRSQNVAAAEDALAEAFAVALETWSREGIPRNPEGWLYSVAARKILDVARKSRNARSAESDLQILTEELNAGQTSSIPDERLSLMFACAHPDIDEGLRTPLILQCVLGFNAANIASAFLVAPSTMGQRLSRAKQKIKRNGLGFRIPEHEELPERLDAVLNAIYAAFGRGWSDHSRVRATTTDLGLEAVWLARVVVALLPDNPEAKGLLALMLFLQSRHFARRDANGDYVPLSHQDIANWDASMIKEAEGVLMDAAQAGSAGRFQIEAAIQSAHCSRIFGIATEWPAIVALYVKLLSLTHSPVVAINHALALLHVKGAELALAALPSPIEHSWLATFQPFHAARAAILAKSGDLLSAAQAYHLAVGLEADPAVRRYLQGELARLSPFVAF